ncbi:MAG TPA: hypothetical protein VFU99_00325 [Gaiellaceae bacterium]|nr:hypothetical protein [Gaiellaceae bacterium]
MATATRDGSRKAPTTSAATPWGAATLVEEVSVPQRVGERRFSVVVQLLETPSGERLVRWAYTTDGSARRGPVTMRVRDLERLRAALERAPVLAQALGSAIGGANTRRDG